MRNLESMTKSSMGYKTRRGAEKTLEHVKLSQEDVLVFVLHREDGTFVPVAILTSDTMYLAGSLARSGVFVFNG